MGLLLRVAKENHFCSARCLSSYSLQVTQFIIKSVIVGVLWLNSSYNNKNNNIIDLHISLSFVYNNMYIELTI